MSAAWFIRSRQMAVEFRFWLAITGYNPRDRSLSQRIYLVYAAVFFSIWGFAVLSLLAGPAAALLIQVNPVQPASAAAALLGILLLAWGIYRLYRATLRSPIVFSENDSYLICQTPADRRDVTLSWFPLGWIGGALPFWGIAVVFGFAQMEILRAGQAALADIPLYVIAGLRAVAVVLPLQAGLLAWVWASGAYRLRPGRERTGLRRIPPLLAAAGLLLAVGYNLPAAAGWAAQVWNGLIFPLRAAFGGAAWGVGVAIALAICAAGLLALRSAAVGMSLAQAARESSGEESAAAVSILGRSDLAAQLRVEQRLASGAPATHLPDAAGSTVLLWKQAVRARRAFQLGDLGPWLLLAAGIPAGLLLPGLGPLLYGLVIWTLVAGQQACAPLRRDLLQWWLFRQLPFSSRRVLLVEIAPASLLVTGLTWLCLALLAPVPAEIRLAAALAAPGAALAAALAGGLDVTRQAKSGQLIAGIVPEEGALGVILGLIGPVLTALLVSWLHGQPGSQWMAGVVGLTASLALAYLYLGAAANGLRKIG